MRVIVRVHLDYAETQQCDDLGISYFKYFEFSANFTCFSYSIHLPRMKAKENYLDHAR